jgi:ribosomal protein L35
MKQKTHKATSKRFRVTAGGKLMHNSQGDNSHLKANKDRGQKARKKGQHVLGNTAETAKIIKLLGK